MGEIVKIGKIRFSLWLNWAAGTDLLGQTGGTYWDRLVQPVPSSDAGNLSVSSWALLMMSMTWGVLNFSFFTSPWKVPV